MFVYTTEMCSSRAATSPVEKLVGAIERFIERPAPSLTPFQLGEELIRLRHGIDLLELDFATEAATFASTGRVRSPGFGLPDRLDPSSLCDVQPRGRPRCCRR
jgi:hypothetical protein